MARLSRRVLHSRFQTALPRIERHANFVFRSVPCWHTKQDKIQEVRSLCWKWVQQLTKVGKQWWNFVSQLAAYACRAVRSGRKVAGMIAAKDVLNEITQAKRSFTVQSLPASSCASYETLYSKPFGQQHQDAFEERLHDNTITPVVDQVQFRLDWPDWLLTRSELDRRLIGDMSLGHRTKDLARKYGKSEGRISQQRREYQQDWQCYLDD